MNTPTVDTLASITAGHHDTVHGAQQAFRALLDALSRPGRVTAWPRAALEGIEPPTGLSLGTTAALLALLDSETTVHLVGSTAAAASYLRFHTGVPTGALHEAPFVAAPATAVDTTLCAALALGSDEAPQHGATLLIDVPSLHGGRTVRLRGPGIETTQTLCVAGLHEGFWPWRLALEAHRPRGVDIFFVCGEEIAALPRSTRIRPEPTEA